MIQFPAQHARRERIARHIASHAHMHGATSYTQMSYALNLPVATLRTDCAWLADSGRIHAKRRYGNSPVTWLPGADPNPIVEPKKSPSVAEPTRRVLTRWEPHHQRDELTTALFGKGGSHAA